MVIKLGLDDADFGRGVANSKKQVSYLAKEMSANMKIADMAGNQLGKLGTKYDSLSKIIGAQVNQVKDLKKAYEDSFVDGKATEQTKRLAAQLQDANGKLANYKLQLQQTAGAMAEYKIKNEGFTGAVNKASDSLITHGKRLESAGSAMTKGLTLPLVAGAAAVTTAAISWESAFAGVLKTNDEVLDKNGKVVYSFKDLENGLRGLAKELPASHQEIAATAEAAGQLGIQTENVVGFTKTMIDLGESTNMSAESAATALARFANITQMSQKDFDKLGSVVVDLGNNFATTEEEIVNMGLRLAGAGKQIGMSEGEIMGFAAALSSVGIEAEAGGSAFSKVMINMQLATEKGMGSFDELISLGSEVGLTFDDIVYAVNKGGKPLKNVAGAMGITTKELNKMYKEADKSATSLIQFSDVAGMTNAEFANLFKTDPSKAIMKFVEGLSKTEEQGKSAIRVLDDMDITEVRLRDSLLRAANASGVFEGAVKKGNKAWKENTALTEEANKRYETTESKLKMLKNEVVDTAIDLGGPFVDALRDSLEVSKPLIKGLGDLAKAFSEASPEKQKMILGLITATATAGPLLSIVGKLSGGVGVLGKSFVGLSAEMAKKKAITEVTEAFISGNVSAGDLMGTLSGGVGTVGKFGGAAATASGPTGIGAMAAAIGPLGPAILGVVGVGGALAIGYGAWKLFGEEAYNSAQRTKEWGVDVGKATGETLSKVKEDFGSATGQFGLMAEGLNANTDAMAGNFEQIGTTIENSLIKKIEGLDELIRNLPASTNQAMSDLLEEEKSNAEKSLKVVQDNTNRIAEIRANASKENRQLNASESKIIMDLAIGTTRAYVDTLDVSADEKKKILSAMTGDVEKASKDEAKLWLQSLGEQRQAQSQHASKSRKEQEQFLEDMGYNLKGEFAQKYLSAWDEISKTTTDGFDTQMATILAKYPELQNEVALANGTLINSNDAMGQAMIGQNKYIIENAKNLSATLATNARKNAEAIKWTADDMTTAGRMWNDLKLVDKEGNIKTNAAEIVTEATKETAKWNEIRMVLHDADLDSNAKKVVGEAAIANGWWDGMAWEDKEAVLQDEVTTNMYKALEANGTWDQMTFDEKKAILYSNTPETMVETMASLGLWDEYLPEIKALGADNEVLMSKLAQSEEKMAMWNTLDAVDKTLLLDNLPLMDKVFESTESMNAWNELDPVIKNLLANGEDLNAKLLDGTIRQDIYSKNIPAVKKLLGDATSISKAAMTGGTNLDTYNKNNPKSKNLTGSSRVIQTEASMGAKMLSAYENNNPSQKFLKGDSSNVRANATTGVNALNKFDSTNPGMTYLRATDNASYNAGRATDAVKNFGRQGNKTVTLTSITKNITQWITEKFTKNATGTNYHPGGLAMVNDQRGAMYRELVQHPTGEMYIPQGRNVMLDLPRGSKVYTAAQTKQMVPKYAEGVGIPKNSTLVRNLESVNSRNIESTTVIQNDNRELVSLMRQMLNTIARLKPAINVNAQGNIEDLNLRNLNSDLGWLVQVERGGLGG